MKWEGIFCALWTPAGADGRVLDAELKANLAFLKDKGISGLLALGSTGEFLHFELAQRVEFLEKVRALAPDLPLIANISDIRPKVVAEMSQAAQRLGAVAVSILPPYFFSVSQDELVEFFARAGGASELPMFLYNFPERVGNRISIETIAAVAERVKLAGVKQSGAEFGYHKALVELGREKGFVVLTGSDTQLPEALAMGVKGCVSGLANAVPEIVCDIYEVSRAEGRGGQSESIERMKALSELVDRLAFPLNVAALMEARGLRPGAFKAVVSDRTAAKYRSLVDSFRAALKGWGFALERG